MSEREAANKIEKSYELELELNPDLPCTMHCTATHRMGSDNIGHTTYLPVDLLLSTRCLLIVACNIY